MKKVKKVANLDSVFEDYHSKIEDKHFTFFKSNHRIYPTNI